MIWRLERFGRAWNDLAGSNPFGAILTDTNGGLRQWSVDEFFDTGARDAARFLAELERIAPGGRRGRLLDFGCGVGRVTRALADHFESVVGMDIAPAMIAQARRLNRAHTRCTFVVNRGARLRARRGTFDVIYSRLVLQHVPPRLVRAYIREFIRVLAPRGVLMFQLPELIAHDSEESFVTAPVLGNRVKQRLPRVLVRAYRHLKYWWIVDDSPEHMAMFGMPQDVVLRVTRDTGGRVLAVAPDQSHGPSPRGYEYWVSPSRV